MPKQPYETISMLLDGEDIRYLSNLLFTIENTKELRTRLIPQSVPQDKESNFVRVSLKLQILLLWHNPKNKMRAIAKPVKPLTNKRVAKQSKPKTISPLE